MFAVVRHPDVDSLGIVPQAAFEAHQARGWYRVSDWRAEPAAFHLPDFFDAPDVEANTEQEPDEAPAKTTKEKTA